MMTLSSGLFQASGSAGHRLWGYARAHVWAIVIALLCLGAGIYFLPRIVLGPEIATEKVVRGDLVQTVVASGHVETPFRVEIGSQVTGTVSDVLVQEGETVKQRQPLILLEASEAKASLVQAQGALAQAQARMRQLKELTLPSAQESLKQAQATLTNAQAAYDRASTLLKTGFQTKAALDDAQKTLDIAKTLARTAELQVYTDSPGGSDYVLAETQLAQAEANLTSAQARLSYSTITSPRDGVLITRNVERGTVVQPGRALLVLAPTGDVQLVLQIDEKNMSSIALGQQALVSADAYPDQTFPAQVSYINPSVDITRASVEVKLTAPSPPAFVRQDMTVSVDIEVASRKNTLVLPTRAVRDLSTVPWILKVVDGRTQKQLVTCGIRAAGAVEILSGAKQGENVVPTTSAIQPGARVRVKPA
jgi:HlyD family secretion protein